MSSMTIGRLAKATGVNIDTIRYYERERLLAEPQRRPSGYRVYDDSAVERLHFIRRAKQLGFTLTEIGELLELSSGTDMSAVRAAASAKLDDVERRIRELQSVRRGLKTVIDACPGHGDPHQCPIIQSLSAGAPPAD